MDKHGLRIAPAVYDRLQWIVEGRQVGAAWPATKEKGDGAEIGDNAGEHELRYLGQPSSFNKVDCDLCLWMGWDAEQLTLLTFLTMSVKLSTGKTGARRRMYLIIPSESLSITSRSPDFARLSIDKVPKALFERPEDHESAKSVSYLHLSFLLQPEHKSKVVMTTQEYRNTVNGTALDLLDGFKTLSEAPQFHLYMPFNTYAQCGLIDVASALQTSLFTSPEPILSRMYRGGQDGGFDIWDVQGWYDRSKSESGKRKRPRAVMDRNPTPPPAYDQGQEKALSQKSGPDTGLVKIISRSRTPDSYTFARSLSGSGVVETPIALPPLVQRLSRSRSASFDVDCSSSSLPRTRIFNEIPLWLCEAWKDCPNAHYLFIEHLLQAGAAARTGDEEGYHNARVACTESLTSYRAARMEAQSGDQHANSSDILNARQLLIRDEPARLISWAITVHPTADLNLFPGLTFFEMRRLRIVNLRDPHGDDKDAYESLCREASHFRANLIADICFFNGAALLQRKDEMKDLMSREMERRGLT